MNSETKRSQTANASISMEDFAKALENYDYEFQKGQVVHGKVFEFDSNGAYVDIGGKSAAFVPKEEASLRTVADLSEVLPLNEELDFIIIREQDSEGQVTLSRRQLELKHIWDRLAEMQDKGQTIEAKVTGVNKGGVTADVLGLRGFIPRSHLVERNDLEALKGQTLTVSFLEIDRNNKKLVVSQRLANRSASFSELEIGQLIEGKITGIKPFGAFVDFGGSSALLHIKQISQNYIENLEKVFHIGEIIKAVVIDLDEGKGRVAVSTRVLENYPGEFLENRVDVMASAEARAERARKKMAE